MSDKEPLREKLVLALVQTLVFGVLLAILGYVLDLRLESNKRAIAEAALRTEVLLRVQEPLVSERRDAYLELRRSARRAKNTVIHYWGGSSPQEERDMDLQVLENALGTGSGGIGSNIVGPANVSHDVRAVVELANTYEEVLSDEVRRATNHFVSITVAALIEGAEDAETPPLWSLQAIAAVDLAFSELTATLEAALGLENLPVR